MKELINELKKCPFCRRGARLWQHGNRTFYVQCVHCNASSDNYRTKEEAIAAWNMREEAIANTRLRAAAPDMYELLYEALQELKGYDPIGNGISTIYPDIEELLARIDGDSQEVNS